MFGDLLKVGGNNSYVRGGLKKWSLYTPCLLFTIFDRLLACLRETFVSYKTTVLNLGHCPTPTNNIGLALLLYTVHFNQSS